MRISVELIPRELGHLQDELRMIKSNFAAVNTVNIPDVMRLGIRSWEGAAFSKPFYEHTIPHLRAIDFNLKEELGLLEYLDQHLIKEVLVVTGDAPQDMSRTIYPTTCTDFISRLKKERPSMKVYAAIDPYRHHLREEYEYVQRKLSAGADGFFTQPFFDLRWMEIYSELLEGQEVFWGVSPVVSSRSQNYWETKNNAVFPKSFSPTLEWNVDFARKALRFTQSTNSHIYFMPIKVDLTAYLEGIFN